MTRPEPKKRQVNCPACDYDHGKSGRPHQIGDRVHCLDCGATWRELGSGGIDSDETSVQVFSDFKPMAEGDSGKSKAFRELLPDADITTSTGSGYTMKEGNRSALYLSSIAGLVFLSCLAASVFLLRSFSGPQIDSMITASISQKSMRVTDVKLEEFVRQNGKKVFRVQGNIENATEDTKALPRILIVLRNERGDELVRWHYDAPVKMMKAGRKLRFASSVQYDTPYAASAEAYFE